MLYDPCLLEPQDAGRALDTHLLILYCLAFEKELINGITLTRISLSLSLSLSLMGLRGVTDCLHRQMVRDGVPGSLAPYRRPNHPHHLPGFIERTGTTETQIRLPRATPQNTGLQHAEV